MAVIWALAAITGAAALWVILARRRPPAGLAAATGESSARFDDVAAALGARFGLSPVREQRAAAEWRGEVSGVEVGLVAYPGSLTVRVYPATSAGGGDWEISGRRSEGGVPTGDEAFDGVISVTGAEAPVKTGLLDAQTRATLADVMPARPTEGKPWFINVKPDRVTAMATGADIDEGIGAAMVERAVAIAGLCDAVRRDPVAHLGRVAREDPVEAVQSRAMWTLARHFQGEHAAREVAVERVVTGSAAVRWWAASMLGDDYREALRVAAGELLNGSATEPSLVQDVTGRLLEGQLGDRSPLLPSLAVACLRDATIADVALPVLAQEGGRESVGPLLKLEERGGRRGDRARDAIARIQSRLPGAGLGHLALTEVEGGGLSVESEAEAQAEGALSVREEPA